VRAASGSALAAALAVAVALASATAQTRQRTATLAIAGAEPRAVVLVDGIRHGRTDASGARTITTLAPGRRAVLVRQPGFADHRQVVTLAAGRTATVRPKKVPLEDEAELAFQRADDLAYSGKSAEAIPLFTQAIEGRGGRYAAAQIGLARAHLALKDTERATAAITALLDAEPRNVEAVTVQANILRERGFYDEAAAAYRRAIALAPKASPEAHTGLAMLLEERGNHAEAVTNFRAAIAQNADAEPILYQLLGASLEQAGDPAGAAKAYERFLDLAPNSSLAPAVRSLLEQVRAAEGEQNAEDEGDVNPFARPLE
jgi:tetratricopeptide (TPR) repeat protein